MTNHKIKSAMVIGATGLVGREIVKLLLADSRFENVKIFVRRRSELKQYDVMGKLQEHVVDFDSVAKWSDQLTEDVLFSALGTTRKTAGSEEAQYKVDYRYQWDVANAARHSGCQMHVLISAAGAKVDSPFFYPRMKGELEADVQALGFPYVRVLRPGLLKGERTEIRGESRPFEQFANRVLASAERLLPVFPHSLKPIPVEVVARAAVNASQKTKDGTIIFAPEELWALGDQ